MSAEHESEPVPELPPPPPPTGQMNQTDKQRVAKNFWQGFTISVGANAAVVAIFFQSFDWGIGSAWSVPFSIAFAGLILQAIFFVVAGIFGSLGTKPGLPLGLITGSALTVLLLPATCFGMVFVLRRS